MSISGPAWDGPKSAHAVRGRGCFPCTPSPDLPRRSHLQNEIIGLPAVISFCKLKAVGEIHDVGRQLCLLRGFRRFAPRRAEQAAGYTAPGRSPLPGRVRPAAFRFYPMPSVFSKINGDIHLNASVFYIYSSAFSTAFSVFPSAVIHDVNPFALAKLTNPAAAEGLVKDKSSIKSPVLSILS